jgi:hypothetical protein
MCDASYFCCFSAGVIVSRSVEREGSGINSREVKKCRAELTEAGKVREVMEVRGVMKVMEVIKNDKYVLFSMFAVLLQQI